MEVSRWLHRNFHAQQIARLCWCNAHLRIQFRSVIGRSVVQWTLLIVSVRCAGDNKSLHWIINRIEWPWVGFVNMFGMYARHMYARHIQLIGQFYNILSVSLAIVRKFSPFNNTALMWTCACVLAFIEPPSYMVQLPVPLTISLPIHKNTLKALYWN